jgi:hypothetical protein
MPYGSPAHVRARKIYLYIEEPVINAMTWLVYVGLRAALCHKWKDIDAPVPCMWIVRHIYGLYGHDRCRVVSFFRSSGIKFSAMLRCAMILHDSYPVGEPLASHDPRTGTCFVLLADEFKEIAGHVHTDISSSSFVTRARALCQK